MSLFHHISPTQGDGTLHASIIKLADRLATVPTPRSLCECGLDSEDYEWLRQWGQSLAPSTVHWWLNNMGFGGMRVDPSLRLSRFEGLGCLLLLLMTEVGRREAREGQIWPVIRGVLRRDTEKLLFDNVGQPLLPLKDAMEAAAERFTLRHVFGREGTLSYYVTVYLQFGFTHAAMTRLPYWLAGYGTTEAITYLLHSDLGSTSFQRLWHTLLNYRQKAISLDRARQALANNPWVLPQWTDELLRWSQERPDVGVGRQVEEVAAGGLPLRWFEEPLLRWEPPGRPVFTTRLINLDAYGLTAERYDVVVDDGTTVATLLRQLDGTYFVTNDITLSCAVARPLLSLVEQGGTARLCTEVPLWDPQEEVTIFVASTGQRIDAWSDAMSQSRAYAVLSTGDLEIVPSLVEFPMVDAGKQRLSYLPSQWPAETRLLLDGEEFWTPVLPDERKRTESEPAWTQRVQVHIAETHVHPGQIIHPIIRGLGEDIVVRHARLGGYHFEVERDHTIARLGAVALSADLAQAPLAFTLAIQHGAEKIRIRRVPDPPLDVVGMVRRCSTGWEPVPEQQALTVHDASAYPYRVLLPRAEHSAGSARDLSIIEGSTFVRRFGSGAAPFTGLEGLGAPLRVVRGPYNRADSLLTLSAQVVNPGVVRSIKYAEGGILLIHLHDELDPGPGHCVVCWEPHRRPRIIPYSGITVHGNKTWQVEYKVRNLSTLMVGIAYDGYRIGASWPHSLHDLTPEDGKGHRPEVLETTAALIRWMHAPILSSDYLDPVRSFAHRYAAETMAAWLLGDGLPDDLHSRSTNEAWMAAMRQVFAGWRPTIHAARDIVETLSRDARTGLEDPLAAALPRLLRWDPLLLGQIVCVWLTSRRQQSIGAQVQALRRQIAGLLPDDPNQLIGQRMIALRQQAATAMGVDENFVALGIAAKALASLTGEQLTSLDAANLEAALAVASFRDYLGLRVLGTMVPLP